MADTKISAMTAAMNVLNADEFPIVSAGANFKTTRPIFLAAAPGEVIELFGAMGQEVRMRTNSANADCRLNEMGAIAKLRGADVRVSNVAETIGMFVTAAQVQIACPGAVANPFFVGVAGFVSMAFDGMLFKITFVAAGGMVCPYIDGTAGAWLGAPADYNVAINRLANAVSGLLGGGIP